MSNIKSGFELISEGCVEGVSIKEDSVDYFFIKSLGVFKVGCVAKDMFMATCEVGFIIEAGFYHGVIASIEGSNGA